MDLAADNPHQLASAPIVVGVDGSPAAADAVRWAAGVAAERGRELLVATGTNLDVTRALLGSYSQLQPDVTESIHQYGDEKVAAASELARELYPAVVVRTEVSSAHPASLLIDLSATAHLLVIGGPVDRTGAGRLGSILLSVASKSEGAVVVVRGAERRWSDGPVVVGVDGSSTSAAATAAAFEEAALRGVPLVAVHAWQEPLFESYARLLQPPADPQDILRAEEEVLGERLAGWQERFPEVNVRREVTLGDARELLADWSERAQLLVVGSRGRGAIVGGLLGSTSNTLVQRSHCPVMVVHEARNRA
ncbi:universal stress protein [Nocardia sp. NPDC057668]|uniref:universal stress protein n=1 Tax=Nocardia sp. NPDC057668 TaxID=3346202 RepID=UPI00366C95EC